MKFVQLLNAALIIPLLSVSVFAQTAVINGNRSIVGTLCVGSSAAALDTLAICKAPVASATRALFNLSNTALSAGSAAGTYLGANPAACTGNFMDFQLADAARAKLTCAGALTVVSSTNNLSIFAATTSAQLLGVLSDETGTGLAVFNAAPTITNPVIANIAPGADFTITQNGVAALTSVNAGAIVNTLYASAGQVCVGCASPSRRLAVAADVTHSGAGLTSQLSLHALGSTSQKLNIGYDTTSNYGFIEAVNESVVFQNLMLQPSGGKVCIGCTVPNEGLEMGTALNIRIPNIKSASGVRYVCVDTNGTLTSQAAACSGT